MIFLDTQLTSELDSYLDRDERLIWAGKPNPGIQIGPQDLFMIPFSIVWCGFSIFWVFMAFQSSMLFAFFGIPFIFVGIYLVFGRFYIAKRKKESTVYGITEKRILIKTGKRKVQVQSFHIATLPVIDLIETKDGRGTITIGPKIPYTTGLQPRGAWPGTTVITPTLNEISDARNVFNQLLQLQQNSK